MPSSSTRRRRDSTTSVSSTYSVTSVTRDESSDDEITMKKTRKGRAKRGAPPAVNWKKLMWMALLGYMVTRPSLWWSVHTGIPNYLKSFGPRFLDRSDPYPTHVYPDAPATVLNIPFLERLEFFFIRVKYFPLRSLASTPGAMYRALFHYKTTPCPDELFDSVFSDYWPSMFVWDVDQSEESKELTSFFPYDKYAAPGKRFFYADFSMMATWAYDPGMYGAGTVVIFERTNSTGDLQAVGIQLTSNWNKEPLLVQRGDAAWDSAKLFVLHGAAHYLVLNAHPMAHFPMDAVNGLTKNPGYMPVYHPVRALLLPHFRFSLVLDDAVLNDWFLSVLLNPYLASLNSFDNTHGPAIFALAIGGFSKYNFWDQWVKPQPEDRPSLYSRFFLGYRPIYVEFVRKVMALEPERFRDEYVCAWSSEIAKHVPGFPNCTEIMEGNTLEDTLVNIMFDLSILHGSQHYSYGTEQVPMEMGPWRIRHRPPQTADEAWDFEKGSQTRLDCYKYYLTNKVFYYMGPYDSVGNAEWNFLHPEMNKLSQEFRAKLWQHDAQLSEQGKEHLISLSHLGPSIDF